MLAECNTRLLTITLSRRNVCDDLPLAAVGGSLVSGQVGKEYFCFL